MKKRNKNLVLVTVEGGVAHVGFAPKGIRCVILDWDNCDQNDTGKEAEKFLRLLKKGKTLKEATEESGFEGWYE